MGDFVEKARTAGETNDFYLTANNNSLNRKVLSELWDDIVQMPEYLTADRPGGFFWMGPAGTITPFHHDLTNNFMAQVIGRKRVKIVPSWDIPHMQNYLHCFSQIDGRVTPPAQIPLSASRKSLSSCSIQGDSLLADRLLPFRRRSRHLGDRLFHKLVFDNDFSSFYSTYGPV